ncbi:MAG: thiamine-phosphate kinase [Betaproteobacteria bacterium]|nr:thiamine-phosphate kinase [Betaproteobacteria bacterium]
MATETVPSEFDLIRRYFTRATPGAVLGVGDDAALLALTPGFQLAVSTDMLVSGRHFFPDTDPEWLGHKALAVNLSDLAAMGARPRWVTLALALPEANEAWLSAFARGLYALADAHGVELIGGDTTRGPLNICITVLGEVEPGQALRRDAAGVGDDIWVSGELGGAALALRHLRGELDLGAAADRALERLHRPLPRVALGLRLRGLAHAAIDLSDGLLADLGHILEHSGVGAVLDRAAIPAATPFSAEFAAAFADFKPYFDGCVLAGGDDYELCFTAAPGCADAVRKAAAECGVAVTRIGWITEALDFVDTEGRVFAHTKGYDHFA